MRFRCLGILTYLLAAAAGCDSRQGCSAVAGETGGDTAAGVVFIDPGPPLKSLPIKPDPATDANDEAACKRVGGDWDDYYSFTTFVTREPISGERSAGKMCWSNREINKLADAGKPCTGQSDCIGNCVSTSMDGGGRTEPSCQSHADEPPCGWIHDGDKYYPVACPMP